MTSETATQAKDRKKRVRARDIRALAFCVFCVLVVFAVTLVVFDDWLRSAVATAAGSVLLLLHPRIARVRRRLLGGVSWEGYYKD